MAGRGFATRGGSRALVAGVVLLACGLAAAAQGTPDRPPRPPAAARPLPEGVRMLKDVEYARVGDRRLLLDLYLPEKGAAPRPLIVWVHGGAWLGGDKADCPAVPLTGQGYAVASVGYRLSREAIFPAQIQDCKAAVRWLRAHAKTYGLDPDRFGAWGSSAGGHLVALLGTAGKVREWESVGGHRDVSSRVQAVCDWFGPSDFTKMSEMPSRIDHDAPDAPEARLIGGPVQENKEKVAKANPITYVTKDAPPFLIMHGDKDDVVPINQSYLLYAALQKAGVEASYHVVEGAGHGFRGPEPLQRVARFFDQRLKGGKGPGTGVAEPNAPPAPRNGKDAAVTWVNPPDKPYPEVRHRTFRSAALRRDVGFNVYLPPGYESSERRFPVAYFLHGGGGNENRRTHVVPAVDEAIHAGKLPPLLLVFPNGAPDSMYSDSSDGNIPVETLLIRELIPHVDRIFRTVVSGAGRAVLGQSMGGFGALKLAFKYPDLFSSVIAYSAAVADEGDMARKLAYTYGLMFGADPVRFRANSPYELARDNADRLRGMPIRLVIGDQDWVRPWNEKLHAHLNALKIPHEYVVLPDTDHDFHRYMRPDGDAIRGFAFAARHFGA